MIDQREDMQNNNYQLELRHKIEEIQVVDAHDHLMSENERLKDNNDLLKLWLYHYSSSDLLSAGLPLAKLEFIRNPLNPFDERWSIFLQYWQYTKYTGFGRALLTAARDLFSIEDINRDSYN